MLDAGILAAKLHCPSASYQHTHAIRTFEAQLEPIEQRLTSVEQTLEYVGGRVGDLEDGMDAVNAVLESISRHSDPIATLN